MSLLMGMDIDDSIANFAQSLHDSLPRRSSIAVFDSDLPIVLPILENRVSLESMPAVDVFLSRYLNKQCPVVIADLVSHWPAASRWR